MGLHVEDAANVAIGVVGHEDSADGAGAFQLQGHIDGVADSRELAHRANLAQQHWPGADADAHGQFVARDGVGSRSGNVERCQRRLHGQRRAHRALRVVLAGGLGPPDGHDGVTDVLVDAPAVIDDHTIEHQPQAIHHPGQLLGVHRLRHRGEAGHVGQQNGDLLALLFARRLVLKRLELMVDGRHQRGDDVIAQNGALRFQRDHTGL